MGQLLEQVRKLQLQLSASQEAARLEAQQRAVAEEAARLEVQQRAVAEEAARHEAAQRAVAEEQRAVAEEAARLEAQQRAVAEEQRAVAEEQRAVAEEAARLAAQQRAVAEEQRAVAEEQRAVAEADVLLERGKTFFAKLKGMSGSASESSSISTDVSRRGAPASVEVTVEEFFNGLPDVPAETVQAAWDVCIRKLGARAVQPATDLAKLKERKFVHPLLLSLLEEAMPPAADSLLRMWYEAAAEDSVPHSGAEPDMLWTHARDTTPCSLGACFSLELKRWDASQLAVGCAQAGNYGRRLMGRLATELLERGAELSTLCVFTAASNGEDVVLIRVHSGVAAGLNPYCGTPCPMEQTPPLPLLRGWDATRPTLVQAAPPAGFAALTRIFSMSPELLNACTLPLEHVDVNMPLFTGRLRLGLRLGCGGSSDVYACSLHDGARPAALKLARAATARVRTLFEAEAATLLALTTAPPDAAPQLLCSGSRKLDARDQVMPSALSSPWPLLLLSPVGVPIGQALMESVSGAADSRAARRDFGDIVMRGILHGLHAAHGQRITHCDVRPSNVVVLRTPTNLPAALLIDYGLSRKAGEEARGLGVRAYAADSIFEQTSCLARAGLDLIGAAYTWISCVYGDDACRAPWRTCREQRAKWLSREAQSNAMLAVVEHAIAVLARPGPTPAAEHWYVWPWPAAGT